MATSNRRRAAVPSAHRTHEGAPARRIGTEAQLRRTVMACLLFEDTFYENGQSVADRIAEGVAGVSQEIAAQIAIEARTQMHLRHAPLWIVREMARRGGPQVSYALSRVIQRADELSEFVAMYLRTGGTKTLTKQIKLGLAEAFRRFDEYQLAKYDRENEVRLRDVLFLCHAKPKDKAQEALWKRLIAGTMEVPDTWEAELSDGEGTKTLEEKRLKWTRLLSEEKLGGLALLRNLRNMTEAGVDEGVIRAAIIINPFKRVLPFRFIAAAKYAPHLEDALEVAMLRGTEEMEGLPGRTAIVIDHSQSMRERLSAKSEMTRFEAACGVAILLREVCEDVRIYAFSQGVDPGRLSYYQRQFPGHQFDKPAFAIVPPRRGFALRDALAGATCWNGTDTEKGKQMADAGGYDRIVIITDEQSATPLSAPRGLGYVINVSAEKNGIGYGKWTHIDGWSEQVVRFIQSIEQVPVTVGQ